MPERVVIVGPGRVGAALGRRLHEAGRKLLGFVGPGEAVTAAVAFAGAGRRRKVGEHPRADVLLFAVGDADLDQAVAQCLAAAPPRRGALWVHTSGCHDLGPFADLAAAGVRRGSLHPVAPFPSASAGYCAMLGQPAVIDGDDDALPALEGLAAALGMRPVRGPGGDRALYHAACALAANGLVALRALVDEAFSAAGGLTRADAHTVAEALMHTAVREAFEHGPVAAMSGPVRRGDAATVGRHLAALRRAAPEAEAAYRALMRAGLRLAERAGLSTRRAAEVREVLGAGEDGV